MFEKLHNQLHIIALFSRHFKRMLKFRARSGAQIEFQIILIWR